jgi:WD40 repeat protein
MRTLRGLQQQVEKVVVSPDGRRIAALSNDWEIGIWDLPSGELRGIVEAPVGYLTDNAGLALNSDGSRLVCSAGTEAKLWDVEVGRLGGRWNLPPAMTEAPAFRGRDQVLLIRQETRGRLHPPSAQFHPKEHPRVGRLYELADRGEVKPLAEIGEFDWYFYHVTITPDGSYFAIEGDGTAAGKLRRSVRIYDGPTGRQVGSLPTSYPPGGGWHALEFDPKGTRLAAALDHNSGSLGVFELPSLKPTGMIPDGWNCFNVGANKWISYSPPTPDSPGSLVLRDLERPGPLLRIVLDIPRTSVRFSPDGTRVIWGSQDGSVTVCDLVEVRRRLAGVGLGW